MLGVASKDPAGRTVRMSAMTAFVARRVVQMVLSLWAAITLVFVAVTQLPGDPVRALFGFRPPPPEIYDAIRSHFHLDEPLPAQYALYMRDFVTGDWGRGFPVNPFGRADSGPVVADVVMSTVPVSAVILIGALVLQMVVGIVAGALAAGRRRLGVGVYALAMLLVATPVVVAAYGLRAVFAYRLRWLPLTGGSGAPQTYILPIIALAALSTGYVALLTRAELRQTLSAPFVKAARGRGLKPWRVVGVHAMRPALTAVVTFVAANVGQLFVGLLVVEGIFRMPGLGGALFASIHNRDRALLIGLVTVVMVAVIIANAVADVVAAALDPRMRPARAD
jgi:ABC-type dipeptide/oligopeptide/nickel transport system permease component